MPKAKYSGFALLELLGVVVLLAIITGFYFNRGGSGRSPDRSTYEATVKRSYDAACAANRMAFRSSVEMFRMNNRGVVLTAESLQKGGVTIPSCPEGGPYTLSGDGTPVCTRHEQNPEGGAPGQIQLPGFPGAAGGVQ